MLPLIPMLALAAGADAAQAPAAEVTALLLEQAKAWNRGDLDAFCEVYAEDAAFVSPTGLTRGRGEVLARYKRRYPDKAAMGTLSFEFVETRVNRARDVASVVARWKLTYPDKTAEGLTLIVLHRTGRAWRIVQDASM